MIVGGFAGIGWVEGMRALGLTETGLELDPAACATRTAAGHATIRCDITRYPTAPFTGCTDGAIFSPPCPSFGRSGKRLGLRDLPLVHQAIDDLAAGRDTRAGIGAACLDGRSILTAEPMRWFHDLRPRWICMEQVPSVLPVWRQYADILTGWGYSTATAVADAADHGLPQRRPRAVLLASRVRTVTAPAPTHAQDPADDLFGQRLKPWIAMAEALGWGYTRRPAPTVTGGGTYTGGPEPFGNATRRAMRAAMENPGHWAWRRPAHTISGTVGHVGGKQVGGHLNLPPEDAAVLQTFRRDYPFHGNKGQVALQIGNAVPPLLAAAVAAVAAGIPAEAVSAA